MKKLFLTTILGLLMTASYAQTPIKAGTVQLGGSVGYSQQNNDNLYNYYDGTSYITANQHTTYKYFLINPMAGYFIADNIAVGLSFGQNISSTNYSYDKSAIANSYQRNSQFNLGAFAQYYRMFNDYFGLVGTLNAGYSHGSATTTNPGGVRSTDSGFLTNITPSIVFFPIPKFSIGTSLGSVGYSYSTSKIDSDNNVFDSSKGSSSSFGASFGLSYLTLSGTYYIGR